MTELLLLLQMVFTIMAYTLA